MSCEKIGQFDWRLQIMTENNLETLFLHTNRTLPFISIKMPFNRLSLQFTHSHRFITFTGVNLYS